MISRRFFLLGAVAAPAIIRIPHLLMPVKSIRNLTDLEIMDAYGDIIDEAVSEAYSSYIVYGDARYSFPHATWRSLPHA